MLERLKAALGMESNDFVRAYKDVPGPEGQAPAISEFPKSPSSSLETRTAAAIRAELDGSRETVRRLQGELREADREFLEAQAAFDLALQGPAIGDWRHALERERRGACLDQAEALRRNIGTSQARVAELEAELAAVDLERAMAADAELLARLITAGKNRLEEFGQAVAAVRKAEDALFDALYLPCGGLRQALFSPQMDAERDAARKSLGGRALAMAHQAYYTLNPDFEVDGGTNMAIEFASVHPMVMVQKSQIANRIRFAGVPTAYVTDFEQI